MFKKYSIIISLVAICLTIFLSGCSLLKQQSVLSEKQKEIEINSSDAEIVDSEEIRQEKEKEGIPSPISGIYGQEEKINKRPFAVMLDNQSKARPQAGLDQAEIIYEMLAEGWITRYMAVFLMNEPESIGPVRSARPYFIDKAMECNALYVHVGGSPQAFKDIKTFKIADIDAMSRNSSIFWRKNHKAKPHNMYTSTAAIRKAAKESNYDERVKFETLNFNDTDKKINGTKMTYIQIPYYKNYKPSFRYNHEENAYYRYINDNPHIDEVSKKHLSAKNIVIQKAETKVIDSEGRLEIKLVGKGKGLFITGGEIREITWKKEARNTITRFYYQDGTEIYLNPGVTWIEVVPSSLEVMIK